MGRRILHFALFAGLAAIPGPASAQIQSTYDYLLLPHAPQSDSARTYSYDANGNLTRSTLRSTGVSKTLEYTPSNMIFKAGGSEYRYDTSGNRIAKIQRNAGGSITKIERYFGAIETDGTTRTKYYFFGSKRVAKKTSSGALSFYHADHLNSTSVVTDALGNLQSRMEFYEFGAVKSQEGTDSPKYAYTGQEWDKETNLYNYNARMYDSAIGKFASADSIIPNLTNPQSLNRYAYVQNNPLRSVDPSGHSPMMSGTEGVVTPEAPNPNWPLIKAHQEALAFGDRMANVAGWVTGFPGKIVRHAMERSLNQFDAFPGGRGPLLNGAIDAIEAGTNFAFWMGLGAIGEAGQVTSAGKIPGATLLSDFGDLETSATLGARGTLLSTVADLRSADGAFYTQHAARQSGMSVNYNPGFDEPVVPSKADFFAKLLVASEKSDVVVYSGHGNANVLAPYGRGVFPIRSADVTNSGIRFAGKILVLDGCSTGDGNLLSAFKAQGFSRVYGAHGSIDAGPSADIFELFRHLKDPSSPPPPLWRVSPGGG